jgi:hypothetical protein
MVIIVINHYCCYHCYYYCYCYYLVIIKSCRAVPHLFCDGKHQEIVYDPISYASTGNLGVSMSDRTPMWVLCLDLFLFYNACAFTMHKATQCRSLTTYCRAQFAHFAKQAKSDLLVCICRGEGLRHLFCCQQTTPCGC